MGDMGDGAISAGRGHSTTEFHVQRARAGDRSSFASLYERLAPSLDAWAHIKVTGALRGYIEPRDVVQETWWRAMDAFGRFDPGRSGFRPWLFAIAQNVLLESYRKRRRSAGVRTDDVNSRIASLPPDLARQASSVGSRLLLDESVKALVAMIALLSEEDRNAVVHMGIEGLTVAETAMLMGSTVEATKKRWQRLRTKLENHPIARELDRSVD